MDRSMAGQQTSRSAGRRVRQWRAFAGLCVVLLVPLAAGATPDALQRSLQNIVFAPLDLYLAPVVTGKSILEGIAESEDPLLLEIAVAPLGFAWGVGVQAMTSGVRGLAGVLELLPGMIVFFLDANPAPVFSPAERADALVDHSTRFVNFRIGIDYTSPP